MDLKDEIGGNGDGGREARQSHLSQSKIVVFTTFLVLFQFFSPARGTMSLMKQYLVVGRDLNAIESSLSEPTTTTGEAATTTSDTSAATAALESSSSTMAVAPLLQHSGTTNQHQHQRHRQLTTFHMENSTAPTLRELVHRNPNYNFTTAICAMIKDAEAYFEEWLDYHLLGMEFDHIYLYDNSEGFDLQNWYEHTHNHPVYSRVQVLHNPTKDQAGIMGRCVHRFGKNKRGPQHDYIAFIDVDEFLVLNDSSYSTIHDVLLDYLVPFGGALTVNWMMVGTSNRSIYAPLPVTRRFQYRNEEISVVIKTIVKSSDFFKLRNPHSARLRVGVKTYTTRKPGHKLKCTNDKCAVDYDRPSNVFLLYHFRYTSQKEYISKRCERGRPNTAESWCSPDGTSLRDDTPSHIQMIPGTVFDDKPWQLLTSKVPKYRVYDHFEDLH